MHKKTFFDKQLILQRVRAYFYCILLFFSANFVVHAGVRFNRFGYIDTVNHLSYVSKIKSYVSKIKSLSQLSFLFINIPTSINMLTSNRVIGIKIGGFDTYHSFDTYRSLNQILLWNIENYFLPIENLSCSRISAGKRWKMSPLKIRGIHAAIEKQESIHRNVLLDNFFLTRFNIKETTITRMVLGLEQFTPGIDSLYQIYGEWGTFLSSHNFTPLAFDNYLGLKHYNLYSIGGVSKFNIAILPSLYWSVAGHGRVTFSKLRKSENRNRRGLFFQMNLTTGFEYKLFQKTFSNTKLIGNVYMLAECNYHGRFLLETGIKTQMFPALSDDESFQSKFFQSMDTHISHHLRWNARTHAQRIKANMNTIEEQFVKKRLNHFAKNRANSIQNLQQYCPESPPSVCTEAVDMILSMPSALKKSLYEMTTIPSYKRLPNELQQAIYAHLVPSSVSPLPNELQQAIYAYHVPSSVSLLPNELQQDIYAYLVPSSVSLLPNELQQDIYAGYTLGKYVTITPTHYKLLKYLSEEVFNGLKESRNERGKQCFSFLLNTNLHPVDSVYTSLRNDARRYAHNKIFNGFRLYGVSFMT